MLSGGLPARLLCRVFIRKAAFSPFPRLVRKRKRAQQTLCSFVCWRRLIFPGRHQPSIVSTEELNYRVRNGNGWVLLVIGTNSSGSVLLRTHPSSFKGSRQKRNSPPSAGPPPGAPSKLNNEKVRSNLSGLFPSSFKVKSSTD